MAKLGESGDVVNCSFCGKSSQQVRELIAGPGVYICNECIDLCNDIVQRGIEGEGTGPVEEAEASALPSGRVAGVMKAGVGPAAASSTGMTAELQEVQRQLARLAQRLAGLVDQGRGDDSIKTDPRPPRPTRAFPDGAALEEAPGEHRVELRYDDSDGRLSGTVSGQSVECHLVRHREVSGRMGDHDVEASWHSGDNYVPQPGGWTPRPDYVSDFPNIPAELTGSFGGHHAELRGVFHLNAQYGFERGSIVGRIGAVHLEATVQSASGGLCDTRTVAVDGTYGTTPFMIYATIDGGLSRGIVHGTIDGITVHLDISRPRTPYNGPPGPPGSPALTLPGSRIDVSGGYQGPPELLAVIVGSVLQFI